MNLREQFEAELDALLGTGPHTINTKLADLMVRCELDAVNPLACKFMRLAVETQFLNGLTMHKLGEISDRLAKRLHYLLEPIGPIEHDHDECVVQLRSIPPSEEPKGRSYYELLVRRGGEIALVRYHKPNGEPRHRIAATVTREVLLRLVDDFAAVVGGGED